MSFPKLVSEVITKARDRYADMSTTKGLDYFGNAWRNLADAADIRYKSQVISITQGTREYALPEDVIDVSSVYYQRTSDPGTWIQLIQTTKDELDLIREDWRTWTQQGEPFEYYIGTAIGDPTAQLARAVLGLVQIPATTTSAGYPNVTIYGQAITDLLSTDTLPAMVNVDEYFVASIKRQYAETSDSTSVREWERLEEKYLGKLRLHLKQLGAHKGTRMIAGWTQRMSSAR